MTDEADEKDETQNPTPEQGDGEESAADDQADGAAEAQASEGANADATGEEADATPSDDAEAAADPSTETQASGETGTDGAGEDSAAAASGDGETTAEPDAEASAEGGSDGSSDATGAEDTTAEGASESTAAGDEDVDPAWAEALAETQDADTAPTVPASASIPQSPAHPVEFPDLGLSQIGGGSGNIELLMDVKLPVSIELGCTTQPISEILQWGQGSIVELDKLAGEPVNLLVNNKLVAKGEVVVVDENFGLRITSLVAGKDRDEIR
jgi:flagellar motor switch protein FliN